MIFFFNGGTVCMIFYTSLFIKVTNTLVNYRRGLKVFPKCRFSIFLQHKREVKTRTWGVGGRVRGFEAAQMSHCGIMHDTAGSE